MTIHEKKTLEQSTHRDEDDFLNAAPDMKPKASSVVQPYEKGIKKGNKRQISITIDGEILRKIDERAAAMGTGRSAFISVAVFNELAK